MQAEKQEKRGTGPIIVALGFAIVLALVAWKAVSENQAKGGKPHISDSSQKAEVSREAERLSKKTLMDFDDGIPVPDSAKKDLSRAADDFDALSEYDAKNIATYMGAGKIYQVLGDDRKAIQRFQNGLAQVPNETLLPAVLDTVIETHYLLSVSLFKVGDMKDSLTEVNSAIKLFGAPSPIYLAQRASIYIQLGNYKDANADLMEGLRVDPEDKRSKQLLGFLIRGASDALKQSATKKLQAKDYRGAVKDCTDGLRIAIDYPPLLVLRGAAYFDLGDRKKAKLDLDRLLIVAPDNKDTQTLQKLLK